LALLTIFAYSNALHGAFAFDDLHWIVRYETLRDLGNYVASLRGYRELPNRWVGNFSFALNYRLGGLDPAGYHAVNVAIHAANAALVYALVVLTFGGPRLRGSSLAPVARSVAFVAAALFAAHPLQTQAVTYVVQRLTSLATFFYLATVVLYATWRTHAATARHLRALPYVLALACALLAMKTKEIAFTLPFALLAFELSFFEGALRRRLLALAPFLATAFVIPVTLLTMRGSLGEALADAAQVTRVQTTMGRLDYLCSQVVVVGSYLRLLVVPLGQNLDPDVPVYRSFVEARVVGSGLLLLSIGAAAAELYRRTSPRRERPLDGAARLAAFGIGWFFLALSVESGVIPIVDLMYEHRVYLPSVGFFLAAAVGGAATVRCLTSADQARAIALAGLLPAMLLASLTLSRNEVWQSELSLWSDTAAKSPNKSRPQLNLGTAFVNAGRHVDAVPFLRRAVELDPASAWAHAQLGAVLLTLGHPHDAERSLREALRLDPKDPEALFNLGAALSSTGDREAANDQFRRFLEVAPPGYADARRVAEARLGR
jgi:tetratricopeptide (TPR) repeat protein